MAKLLEKDVDADTGIVGDPLPSLSLFSVSGNKPKRRLAKRSTQLKRAEKAENREHASLFVRLV